MSEVNREEVKRQIEFYFSDSNFRKDSFLKAQAAADPNGYVAISVLLTFNKLKAMTTDAALIADIMSSSESVDVSADKLSLKRNAELPANDDSGVRTLYVKGYPTEDADVTIEAVSKQFSEYGKVLMVRMRREKLSKALKGSCFIEFDSAQAVADAVAAANKDGAVQIGFKDNKFLCVMPYTEWAARKEAKMNKSNKSNNASGPASGKRSADGAVKEEEKKVEFTSGLIFHVTNIPADASLYDIKDFFKAIADIKFVDHEADKTEAYVRTADTTAAERLAEALKKGITMRESNPNLEYKLLEGEEEETYWNKIAANSKSGPGGRGGRGGRGGGRGGRGGRGFKKARRN